jgi:transcriptional regulator with XRE-family HTH domain
MSTMAVASSPFRREELRAFLRSRRARLSPADVGLPDDGGRRRTPGLRREELAALAGVGVSWYTWLEQGRDIKVSEQVLEAIARTLLLDRDERAHLFVLAGGTDQTVVGECDAVSPQQHAMLAKLEPYPACIQTGKYDILAYNTAYRFLVADLETVPASERNCMWLAFTDPAWRKQIVDWDETVERMVANLRVMLAEHVGDATWKSFVARLRAASPEFGALWDRHEVRSIENKPKRFRHPDVGMLRFEATNTWLAPRAGRRMIVYVPTDAQTEQRLRTLLAGALTCS